MRSPRSRLQGDELGSQVLQIKPNNIDVFPEVAMGRVEVDLKDDTLSRRLTPLEARMADVVILAENLGQDTKGRRWLSTSMAIKLEQMGFKGIVIVRTDDVDKHRLKHLQTAHFVHAVITKKDSTDRVKVNIVFAFVDPGQAEEVRKIRGALKRNNSLQRDRTAEQQKNSDPVLVGHRISERRRRKSSESVPTMASDGKGKDALTPEINDFEKRALPVSPLMVPLGNKRGMSREAPV